MLSSFKTKEQIEKETGAKVFLLKEFKDYINTNSISSNNGEGFFHDGQKETEFSVWVYSLSWDSGARDYPYIEDYPFVCWYSKEREKKNEALD